MSLFDQHDVTPRDSSSIFTTGIMWQSLASELIFEILIHAFSGSKLVVFQPHLFPWYLGQICQSWRVVFVTSPQFWNAFHIDFWNVMTLIPPKRLLEADLPFAQRALELVMLCIHRSKDYPILFKYITTASDLDEKRPLLRFHCQILAALVAESARWQEADIVLQPEEVAIFREVHASFPLLHALQFSVIDDPDDRRATILNTFSNAPHLTRVVMEFDRRLKLPWPIMKAMEIRVANDLIPACLDALRATRCLETLTLTYHVKRDATAVVGRFTTVTLPSLKILYVDCATNLILFRCPNLEQLWVDKVQFTNAELSSFCDGISAFFSSVHHLRSFVCEPQSTASARIIWQHMPRTDYLNLITRNTATLDSLISSCPNTFYLRSLTLEFGLRYPGELDIWFSSFAAIIKASGQGNTEERRFGNIEVIELKIPDHLIPASAELEKECDARGIQLVVQRGYFQPMRSEYDVKILNI